MNCVIQWLNDNSGALMVLITLVYVFATISISCSNKRSAVASRQQIEQAQKQQEQNAGLQLYSMRKDVVRKIAQKQYNEVFWDVPLLFNEELFSEFQKVAFKAGKVEELQESIDCFEAEFEMLAGPKALDHIKQTREKASTDEDMGQIKESVIQILNSKGINADLLESIKEYTEQIAEAKEVERQRDAESVLLFLHLNAFVKESIQ